MKRNNVCGICFCWRLCVVILSFMLLRIFLSRADNNADEAWSKEGIDVRISGQFEQHGQTSDDVPIKAAGQRSGTGFSK